jgi:hypothetical protein
MDEIILCNLRSDFKPLINIAMKTKKLFEFKTSGNLIIMMLVMILFLTSAKTFSQTGKTDFSGTWAFNEAKSTPSDGGFRMGASLMVITPEGNNLSYESTRKNQDGEDVKSTLKFTLDGKECVNPSFGNSTRKSIVTWSADGKILNFAHTMNFQDNEFKSTESWKLNDNKTLSVETIMNFQGEERKITNIYDKK